MRSLTRAASRAWALIGLVLAGTAGLAGQDMSPEDLFELSLEELLEVRVDVATRHGQTARDAPSSVTVYSRQTMERMGLTTLEEVLNFIPGLQSGRIDQISANPVMRGHRTNPGSQDILVMIDGIRVNHPVVGGAFENFAFINLANVERIEVIRGPGSAIYGSNAMSGVINVVTARDRKEVSVRAGQIGTFEGALQWADRLGGIDVSLFARAYDDDGHEYEPFFEFFGEFEPTEDPISGQDAMLHLSSGGADLSLGYFRRKRESFVAGGGQLGAVRDGPQRSIAESWYGRLEYEWHVTDALSLTSYADHVRFDWDFLLRLLPGSAASAAVWSDNSVLSYIGGNAGISGNTRIGQDGGWDASPVHVVRFGWGWLREDARDNYFQGNWDARVLKESGGTVTLPLASGINRGFYLADTGEYLVIAARQRDVFSAYVQDEWQAHPRLAVTAGLHYDNYQGVGDDWSVRGAATFDATDQTKLKVFYGAAFRAPNFIETDAKPNSITVGNPDLQPEQVGTFEVAASQRTVAGEFTLTYFDSKWTDVIRFLDADDILEGFDATMPQNVGTAHQHGVELEAIASLSDEISLRSGLTRYFEADESTVSSTLGFAVLNYHRGRWNVNLNGFYHGGMASRLADEDAFPTDVRLDGYTVANAKVVFSPRGGVSLFVQAHNLFGNSYRTYSGSLRLHEGVPSRGRTVTAGAGWRF